MISFIVPFMTIEKDKFLNINDGFEYSDSANMIYATIKQLKISIHLNVKKKFC